MFGISLRLISCTALAIGLCAPLAAEADKLSDFKSAADRKGCDAIPYGSQRGSCKGLGSQVDKYCKTDSFTCKSLGTKSLIEKIEQMKKARQLLVSKGETQKAGELQKKIDESQRKLEDDKEEIQTRLEMATACLNSRKSVRTLFANVKSKVRGESDKELKVYVDKLVKLFESEERGHDAAITNADNAVGLCKQSKSGSR